MTYKRTLLVYIPVSYGDKGLKTRDEIEKKLEKMGKWVGHGSGFGFHDVQYDFKDEKEADRAKTVAVNIMSKHGVSGKFAIHVIHPKTANPKTKKEGHGHGTGMSFSALKEMI